MKLLHVTFQFQYGETIEAILERHGVERYVHYPRIFGRDRDGKHRNSQVFPGNAAAIHAHVPDDDVDAILEALRAFRDRREAHAHLEAVVLPIERSL